MTQAEAGLGFLEGEESAGLVRARDGHEPFLASGRRDRVAGFFSMDELAALVDQTGIWTPDRLEVLLDTRKAPPQSYFTQMPRHNGVRYRLETAKLRTLLDRGASIILNDIDSLRPGLKRLRTMIAGFTGGKVECNLYWSQRGHQAFPVHFDVHDVYAFQVAGEKRWRIYQQLCRHPINHLAFMSGDAASHERQKGAVSLDVTLQRGDFLYLPAGYYHQAICTGETSTHLSFSSVEMAGLDVISELFERAVLEEFFRTPIGRTLRNGNRPLADYLKALAENIGTLAADDAFVRSIETRLRTFPWPADEVGFKKEGGA